MPKSVTRRTAMTALAVAAVPAASLPALAAEPDPVFAAIENHKALWAEYCAVVGEEDDLAKAIPRDRHASAGAYHVIHRGTGVGANDDPRWTAYQDRLWAASNAADNAAWDLIDAPWAVDVTPAGLGALLAHTADFISGSHQWPKSRFEEGDRLTRYYKDWVYELLRSSGRKLKSISAV
jgi:hypothetical protein